MAQYINKDALVAKIERLKADVLQKKEQCKRKGLEKIMHQIGVYNKVLSLINTLEVKDHYEQHVQYDSIRAGIQAHAETYSFNIESKLFNQLTKEQQELWRKEIEQACISGGEMGVELARDTRYKENLEVKGVDLEKESELIANGIMISVQSNKYGTNIYNTERNDFNHHHLQMAARKGIELGIKETERRIKYVDSKK